MDCKCQDYRTLPAQNPLFLAFEYDFDQVRTFFQPPPSDPASLSERASEVLSRYRCPRPELVAALEAFNRRVGGGEAVFENLRRLAREDTVAVVSGQQVGLFGGPGYTLYKAATAVQRADWLRQHGISAVPIFWLAADDSDFEEVRTASFIDREARVHTIRHADPRPGKETMAGFAPLRVEAELQALTEVLGDSPFGPETLQLLGRTYEEGATFTEGFARLMAEVFRRQGLVLFDSTCQDVRRHLGGFFETAVRERQSIVERLLERSRQLRRLEFEPQVAVDETETLLFWVDGQQRFKLKFEGGRYTAKDRKSLRFTPQELAEAARRRPEHFGFNALLRPLLQDTLFPTAIYVGGPAEVAYFAQVNAIADLWNICPVIQMRASFTLLDRKSQRLLAKYGLDAQEVLSSSEQRLAEKILRQGELEEVLKLFAQFQATLKEGVEDLQSHMEPLDPPLVDMLANALSKMDYQIGKVQQRFVANQKDQAPHLKAHLDHLLNRLRPQGKPQERFYTFAQFLAEEGPGLVQRLLDQIRPDCPSHCICNP